MKPDAVNAAVEAVRVWGRTKAMCPPGQMDSALAGALDRAEEKLKDVPRSQHQRFVYCEQFRAEAKHVPSKIAEGMVRVAAWIAREQAAGIGWPVGVFPIPTVRVTPPTIGHLWTIEIIACPCVDCRHGQRK